MWYNGNGIIAEGRDGRREMFLMVWTLESPTFAFSQEAGVYFLEYGCIYGWIWCPGAYTVSAYAQESFLRSLEKPGEPSKHREP